MAKTALHSKRKFSSMNTKALPEKVTPPAPQKPGKLKSILKRPSPPSRFMAATPSAQIELESHAVAHNFKGNAAAPSSAPIAAPAAAKKPKREMISAAEDGLSTDLHYVPPSRSNLVIMDDSAGATDLPVPRAWTFRSPRYEDDGDTEDLITDSQPQTVQSDETLLMSGGLGPGESAYKGSTRTANVSDVEPSLRKRSPRRGKKRKSLAPMNDMGVLLSRIQPMQNAKLAKCGPVAPELEQHDHKCTLVGKVEESGSRPTPRVLNADVPIAKKEPCIGPGPKLGGDLPTRVNVDPVLKLDRRDGSTPMGHTCLQVSAPQSLEKAHTDPRVPASPKTGWKASQRRASVLADVSKVLQEYDEARETDVNDLQNQLHSARARATQLEAQLGMLRHEFATRSKERELQSSWNLNKYAIFSRRTYALHGQEEMKLIGGCDDLGEANKIACGVFKREMDKVESVVEDLGQRDTFCDGRTGMPNVQMRSTPCGLMKCRSYHLDNRWDLTVERVAAGCGRFLEGAVLH